MRAEADGGSVSGIGRTFGLWAGWLSGPLAWASQFLVAYAMAPKASAGWGLVPLHLTTVAGLLGTALGGGLAWRAWRRGGGGGPTPGDEAESGRERFLAIQGLLTAPLFAALILAQWAAVVLLYRHAG